MEEKQIKQINSYYQRRKRRKIWYRVVSSAAAVVVFVTTYLLILPALTLESAPVCGKEQHVHTEECYLAPQPDSLLCAEAEKLHVHTPECYDTEGKLVCGYADYFLHTHDESCYIDGILVCGLKEEKGHRHEESCYGEQRVLLCAEEENTEIHTHDGDCYITETKLHQHTDSCYDSEGKLVCAYAFCTPHIHSEACYDEEGALLCGQEEGAEHQHTEACYETNQVLNCTLQEGPQGHQHTEACYGTERVIICGKEEIIPHEHTDACFVNADGSGSVLPVCGRLEIFEHVHKEECYPEPVLTCGLEEHEHDESCYPVKETTAKESENESAEEAAAEEPTEEDTEIEAETSESESVEEASAKETAEEDTEIETETSEEASEEASAEESEEEEASIEESAGEEVSVEETAESESKTAGTEMNTEAEAASEAETEYAGETAAEESSEESSAEESTGEEEEITEEDPAIEESTEEEIDEEAATEAELASDKQVVEQTASAGTAAVTVRFDSGCLPENVTLLLEEIDQGSQEYNLLGEQIAEKLAQQNQVLAAIYPFDISFVDSDSNKEVEPEGPVFVSLIFSEAVTGMGNSGNAAGWGLFHVTDEGETEDFTHNEGTRFTFDDQGAVTEVVFYADTFSEYVLAEYDSAIMLAGEEDEDNGTLASVSLDSYITNVTFRQKGSDGIWRAAKQDDNGKYLFEPGDENLEFTINYTIPAGVVTPNNHVVTYQLPSAFVYKADTGSIKWNDSDVGTYRISNGIITLNFSEDSIFFDTDVAFDGYITFKGGASAEIAGSSNHYEFNDQVKIDYTVSKEGSGEELSNDSSFNVNKAGEMSLENDAIKYTLDITPGSNGATNVTFNDELEITGINVDVSSLTYDSIKVKDASGNSLEQLKELTNSNYGVVSTTDEEGVVTTVTYTDGNYVVCTQVVTKDEKTKDEKTITTPAAGYYVLTKNADGICQFSLPDMEANQKYTVTYKLDLSGFSDKDWVQNAYIKNKVTDSNGSWKAEKTNSITNRWITKKYTGVTENEEGNFEVGWEVTLNPDHKEMQLSDVFTDTLETGSIPATNGEVTVVVKDANDTIVKNNDSETVTVALSALNEKCIEDILKELKLDTSYTSYSIQMQYTTTIAASELKNGENYITNTGTLKRGGKENSAGSTATIQNNLLTKNYDGTTGASFETISYYNNLSQPAGMKEEEVILIPWNCVVKIPENATAETEFKDTFEKNGSGEQILWATPSKLQESLTIITSDNGKLVQETDYIIYYQYGENLYTYKELAETAGMTAEQASVCQVTGFSVKLTESGLKALQGENAYLSYQSYGTYEDINNGNNREVSRVFKNIAKYGNITSNAQYNYTSSYFNKYGYNGGFTEADTEQDINTLKDGKLAWRIETKLSGNFSGRDLTLTDYLPAGLELSYVGLMKGLGGDNDNSKLLSSDEGVSIKDGKYTGSLCYDRSNSRYIDVKVEVSTDESDGRRRIAVTIPGTIVEVGSWFFLYIEADIPAKSALRDPLDFGNQRESFTNEATLSVNGTEYSKADNTIVVTNEKSQLDKSGIYLQDSSKIQYYLEINPGAQDLLPNSDVLTLTDVLEYEPNMETYENAINLVSGSVRAYYYESGDTEKANKIYLPANGYDFSYTFEEKDAGSTKRDNILTVQIPDGITVYLEYEYKLYANQSYENATWNIVNRAELSGVSYGADSDKQYIKYVSSSAGVTKNTITFYKVDQDNYTTKLPGAEFMLYQWRAYDTEWTKEAAEAAKKGNDNAILLEDDSGCWELYTDNEKNCAFTSGLDGKFTFSDLKLNTLYQLVETKAPTGYVKNEAGYYFYIHSGENEITGPENKDELNIQVLSGGNLIFISNKNDQKIHATKVWAEGTVQKDIELTLFQGTGAGYTYADTLGENPRLTPIEVKGQTAAKTIAAGTSGEELTVTWDELPETDSEGKKLYYYVFETKVDGKSPDTASDGSALFGGVYQPEYSNNNGISSGNVIITNREVEKKSISAEKIWGDGADPVDIELTLYQSVRSDCTYADLTGEEGQQPALKEVQFDSASGQTAAQTIKAGESEAKVTWTDLPAYDENANALYYYVFETKAGDASPSWTSNGYKIGNYDVIYEGNGVTEGTVTVRNDATELTVSKVWGDGASKPVTMTLYSSTERLEPENAGDENAEHSITLLCHANNLEGSVEYNGVSYYSYGEHQVSGRTIKLELYYSRRVEEPISKDNIKIECSDPDVTCYSPTLEGSGYWGTITFIASHVNNDCQFYVISFDSSASVSGCKISQAELPTSAKPSNLLLPENAKIISSIILGAETSEAGVSTKSMEYTWRNLPKSDGDGNPLYYYVKETAVDSVAVDNDGTAEGYKGFYQYDTYIYQDGEKVSVQEGEGYSKVVVTNIPLEIPDSTNITIKKEWADSEGSLISDENLPESVQVQLYRSTDGNLTDLSQAEAVGAPVAVSKSTSWSYTYSELDAATDAGARYYYYVAEVTEGYSPEITNNGILDGTITLKNIVTSLKVKKEWKYASGAVIKAPPSNWSVQLQLYKQNADETWTPYGDPVALPDDGSWEKEWTALPDGKYYVEEVEINGMSVSETGSTGFIAAYRSDSLNLTVDAKAAAVNGGTITIINTEEPTSISVQKKWFNTDGDDISDVKAGSISFDLYRTESETPPVGEGESEGGNDGGIETNKVICYRAWQGYDYDNSLCDEIVCDKNVQVGSEVQITIKMVFYMDWDGPTIQVIGIKNLSNVSWSMDSETGNSVGTCKGTVTGTTVVVGIDYPKSDFSVEIVPLNTETIEPTNPSESESTSGEEETPAEPTGSKIGEYTISESDSWILSINNLPRTGTSAEGKFVYYTYYVQEHSVVNYSTEYENNDGIVSGTIIIKNTGSGNPEFILPETGGPGTKLYTLGGLLLTLAAAHLLYKKRSNMNNAGKG